VRRKDLAVAGRDLPHPQLGLDRAREQDVGSVMPEHALK